MPKQSTTIEDLSVRNVVKTGKGQGSATQIGDIRILWKAEGEATGFQFSVDQVTLQPGQGVPLHRHAFAEFFYVVDGELDFAFMDEQEAVHWVRCSAGESVLAPPNAPHTFHNRSSGLATFVGVSTYQHELMLKSSGEQVAVTDPMPASVASDAFAKAIQAMTKQQCFIVEV